MEYNISRIDTESLQHFGIKGQKWGVRLFENADGTLTEEGKIRYGTRNGGNEKLDRQYNKDMKKMLKLDDKADSGYQKQMKEEYVSSAKSRGLAAIGLALTAVGANNLPAFGKSKVTNSWTMNVSGIGDVGSGKTSFFVPDRTMNTILTAIGGVSAAAVGTAAVVDYAKSRSAKRNTSAKGHNIAVVKRDQEYNRIKNKYSGTKYSGSVDSTLADRRRDREKY